MPVHATDPARVRTPSVFTDSLPLPKLFVFDLDYTLWPLWVDCHVSGSLKPSAKSPGLLVRDRQGEEFGFYADVAGLFLQFREKDIAIAAASRTSTPDIARKMLGLLKIGDEASTAFFDNMQIYPGTKTTHFEKIHKALGIEYNEMLFFDDESRNRNVEQLGVVMQLVRDGVTVAEVEQGVKEWRRRNGRTAKKDAKEEL